MSWVEDDLKDLEVHKTPFGCVVKVDRPYRKPRITTRRNPVEMSFETWAAVVWTQRRYKPKYLPC